jgi:hypothetical protein
MPPNLDLGDRSRSPETLASVEFWYRLLIFPVSLHTGCRIAGGRLQGGCLDGYRAASACPLGFPANPANLKRLYAHEKRIPSL